MQQAGRRSASGAGPSKSRDAAAVAEPQAPPAGEAEPASQGNMAHPDWLRAYQAGEMDANDAIEFEQAVRSGELAVPQGFQLRYTQEGPLDLVKRAGSAIAEAVTGSERQTDATRAGSDIVMSPEWRRIQNRQGRQTAAPVQGIGDVPGAVARSVYEATLAPVIEPARAALREASSPEEQIKMIQDLDPRIQIVRDEKGNLGYTSPENGQFYTIQPGLNVTDVPRIASNIGIFAPSGGVTGLARAAGGAALTQGLQEAEQAASGGEFNPGEIGLAAAGGALGELGGRAIQGLRGMRKPVADAAGEVIEQGVKAAPEVLPGPELGKLVTAADGGDAAARRQLAQMANVDAEAAKAAADLGLDVPFDVLAQNQQIAEIGAALRSKQAGEAAGQFAQIERQLGQKADEALQEMGALFVEGRPQPASVSERVLGAMQGAIAEIKGQASALYKQVDNAVPGGTRVPMDNVRDLLEKRVAEYGGDVASLSAAEQRLLKMVERNAGNAAEGAATYRALVDEKAAVQRALRNEMAQGAYGGADRRLLGQLETALKNDQLAAAEAIGGKAAADALKTANRMTFKQKAMEARAMQAFGKGLDGDLAPLMKRALAGAAKGENKALRQMMKVVPEEYRREAAATALASIGRKPDGAFSAQLFQKNYAGLRANPEAYSIFAKEVGPEGDKLLQALYAVSNRISKAAQATPRTGKALDELGALEGIMGKVVESGLAQKAATGAGAAVGAAVAGPGGASAGAALADNIVTALANRPKRVIEAAANLMRDPAMVDLALAGGAPSEETIKRVARSQALREFLRAAKMPRTPSDAEAWVWGAVRGVRAGEQDGR